jgi:hypothetical protein
MSHDLRRWMTLVERSTKTTHGRNPLKNPQFRAWFGNSTVVNPDGTPMVMYHGTDRDFDAFSEKELGSRTDHGVWGIGFYFMNDAEWGSAYAETENPNGTPNVRLCYLRVENPYYYKNDLPNPWKSREDQIRVTQEFTQRIRQAGHDGIVVRGGTNSYGKVITEYVVFKPNQIKSIFNRGAYAPDDDRMSESQDFPHEIS